MYGANYLGQPQYAQGPAIYNPPVTHSVDVTVTCTASCSPSTIVNQIVSVTVVCTAVVTKQLQRSITATVTTVANFASSLSRMLRLLKASTASLMPVRTTLSTTIQDSDAFFQADYFQNNYFQIGTFSVLGGTATETKTTTPVRTTIRIED